MNPLSGYLGYIKAIGVALIVAALAVAFAKTYDFGFHNAQVIGDKNLANYKASIDSAAASSVSAAFADYASGVARGQAAESQFFVNQHADDTRSAELKEQIDHVAQPHIAAPPRAVVTASAGRLVDIEQPIGRSGETRPAIAYDDPATGRRIAPDPGFGFNPGREWQRPFTPPPLDTLPRTFPSGVELPELPTPTPVPASSLLPGTLTPQQYAAAFLKEFGFEPGQVKVFEDVAHTPLVVSDDLFKTGDGSWKADKDGRGPYMALLAQAIQSPDEIWLRWEQSRDEGGKWLLKRRYIKSWLIDGQDGPQYGLSVFESGQDGWSASTAMMSNADRGEAARRRYIEKQRDGFLAYRK